MDHMRISGTEPSSVILSQKGSSFKNWKVMSKTCQKQADANLHVLMGTNPINKEGFYMVLPIERTPDKDGFQHIDLKHSAPTLLFTIHMKWSLNRNLKG